MWSFLHICLSIHLLRCFCILVRFSKGILLSLLQREKYTNPHLRELPIGQLPGIKPLVYDRHFLYSALVALCPGHIWGHPLYGPTFKYTKAYWKLLESGTAIRPEVGVYNERARANSISTPICHAFLSGI
jgi:hypothetical protein